MHEHILMLEYTKICTHKSLKMVSFFEFIYKKKFNHERYMLSMLETNDTFQPNQV